MNRSFSKVLFSLFLFLCMLLPFASYADDEIVYWVYPNGGRYYHMDQNCPTVNPRYLPLKVSLTKEELELPENSIYAPCNICVNEEYAVPEELRETGTPTEEPVWEMKIDPQYAEYALTDRYVREAPVFLDEHNMLAKADTDPVGYAKANKYLQWYRDGKIYREIECKYRDPSRWLFEGIFLSLPNGDVGLASIEANTLHFYRWDEEGLIPEKEIPGKWIELYGNTKAVCAVKSDGNGTTAHLFDPAGQEIWTCQFNDPTRLAGWLARPTATDEAGTYLTIARVENDLLTAFFIRNGETVSEQNILYGAGAFYVGDQTYILAETTSDDHQYADIVLDHRDFDGNCLGTKRLSGDRVVKSFHAIQYNPESGGYTVYGRAVANSRGVYTVFRMELDSQMNQQSISVRSFDLLRPDRKINLAPTEDFYSLYRLLLCDDCQMITGNKPKEERNMLKKVFMVILVVSLMAFSTAVASETGFFGELAQVEYADERLPALEKVAGQVPASSLTKNGITVELGQGYFEGNRVFISFKISANTELIELYEGAPDAGIKWKDSMENMIIGEEPANSPDVKKQYDWLDGKSQHWVRVPSCSTGDGLELIDGTYLDIVAGYQKDQADGTILGWKECIIPEGKEADSLTFKVPFCWYTMIRFQDYTTYKETIESSENDSINFTLNRNNSFQTLQGASQAASYQATATVSMGNVDVKGKVRIISSEQAASWLAWQEGEEGTGTDVISCWNLYQNGELVSADLYGASEVIGTDEVVFEVMFPHMDDINGLSLVPEYSEGGEKPDEAITLEPVIQ